MLFYVDEIDNWILCVTSDSTLQIQKNVAATESFQMLHSPSSMVLQLMLF